MRTDLQKAAGAVFGTNGAGRHGTLRHCAEAALFVAAIPRGGNGHFGVD